MSLPTADADLRRTSPSKPTTSVSLLWPSLLVALTALAGSLWLSVGMGLKACPLSFYQRTFVMGVVAVLGIGLLTGERHRAVLKLLAFPLVVAGFGVAAFHVFLELTVKLECPSGVMGIGTAPQQSLTVLALLLTVVLVGVLWSRYCSHAVPSCRHLPWVVGSLARWFIVTPAMHKMHHSDWREETDSNYSSILSVWDRLARSFRMRDDPKSIVFGLNEFTSPGWQTFGGMLKTPFVNPTPTSGQPPSEQPEPSRERDLSHV